MTYEERKKRMCTACASRKENCGYVSRGLESKCPYLSDAMDGWELGRGDTLAEAVSAKVVNIENGKATIIVDLPKGATPDNIKVLIIKN